MELVEMQNKNKLKNSFFSMTIENFHESYVNSENVPFWIKIKNKLWLFLELYILYTIFLKN